MSLEYGVIWNYRQPRPDNVDGPFGSIKAARDAARDHLASGVTAKVPPEFALVRRHSPEEGWYDFQNRDITDAWIGRWADTEDRS